MTISSDVEKFLAAGKRHQQTGERRRRKFAEFTEWAQDVFGEQLPLFIPSVVDCKKGTRTPIVKWKQADRSLMEDNYWLRCMEDALTEEKEDGCIQVKLGEQSFHLCVLDVDADELVEPLLEVVPALRETLQTRGSKGRHFWVYMEGDYPRHKKQIIRDGLTIEFLTEGNLCTIWGTHYKTGEPYQVLHDTAPITLKFQDIKPPAGGEWKAKASTNGAGTNHSRNHTHGTAGKHGGFDWAAYDAEIAAQDGLVDILVEEYFDATPSDEGWRCADITGRPPSNKGSFVIEPNGRCTEWDDESHCTIMQAITSDLRDEKNTFEDVFTFLAEEAGLNFFMPSPPDNQVILPQKGQQLKGEFVADVANVLKDEEFWFTSASKTIVRIDRSVETWVNDEGVEVEGRERLRLFAVGASEAESTLEEKVDTGVIAWEEVDGKKIKVFQKHSLDNWTARMLLKAPRLIENLPRIDRVLDVTIPISIGKDTWLLPKPGYNRDLKLLLDTDIQLQEMPLQEAKILLAEIVADFPFADDQSRTNWYARLITPMCRGIMGFNHRVPLFTFMGNRPRAGKDYLNGVAQTLFYGAPFEDPSISASSSEETRKRITTALSAGRRSMHIANQQAFLDDAVFIAAITAPIVHDRRLGKNDAEAQLEFRNELEFTMSSMRVADGGRI